MRNGKEELHDYAVRKLQENTTFAKLDFSAEKAARQAVNDRYIALRQSGLEEEVAADALAAELGITRLRLFDHCKAYDIEYSGITNGTIEDLVAELTYCG